MRTTRNAEVAKIPCLAKQNNHDPPEIELEVVQKAEVALKHGSYTERKSKIVTTSLAGLL